jgi:lysophospholipase L1-like esterase
MPGALAAGIVFSVGVDHFRSARGVVFGDSTLLQVRKVSMRSKVTNLAISGSTITQIAASVEKFAQSPTFYGVDFIVVGGGVNDMILGSTPPIEQYQRIFSAIPSDMPIYVVGILPVVENHNRFGLSNGSIRENDAKIAAACALRVGCSMVDVNMQPIYFFDGLHPNVLGGAAIGDAIGR